MSSGDIKVAEHDGVYVIKMEGDVRLTLCLSFDDFIERMLSQPDFCSVVFDLTRAKAIDSTTLGLMAKISIRGRALHHSDPVVISDNPSITRLLVSMGFEDIFNLVDHADVSSSEGESLQEKTDNEEAVHDRVLEAHRLLMDLNSENVDTFSELVETLEATRVKH